MKPEVGIGAVRVVGTAGRSPGVQGDHLQTSTPKDGNPFFAATTAAPTHAYPSSVVATMKTPVPDPYNNPKQVYETLEALIHAQPLDWRPIAKYLKGLGWKLDRSGRLPDVIARKQFQPGPQLAAYVPQAVEIEMGFALGFAAAAHIIHARQGAASTLIAPPSDPAGN